MTAFDKKALLGECLSVLQYYLEKTERIMKLYQDTAETQYFLFAIRGTISYIKCEHDVEVPFLAKCIDGLIAGQKSRKGDDRLGDLRRELKEELELLKLRYNV